MIVLVYSDTKNGTVKVIRNLPSWSFSNSRFTMHSPWFMQLSMVPTINPIFAATNKLAGSSTVTMTLFSFK